MGNDAQFLIIGSFSVRWNGVIIMLAAAVGIITACSMRKAQKRNVDDMLFAAIAALVCGFVGARFYYYWNMEEQFSGNGGFLDLTNGGYGLYGGLFGFAAAILATALIRRRKPGELLDAAAPGIAIAVAIGRWGAAFTGENIGEITESFTFFPLAMYNETENSWRSSLFLYQSVIALVLFFVTQTLVKRKYADGVLDCASGDIFLLFAILYAAPQGVFEELRADRIYFNTVFIQKLQTVPVSLCMSAVASALALSVFILRAMKRKGINLGTLWPVAACAAAYLCYFNITLRFELPSETLSKLVLIIGSVGLILVGIALFRSFVGTQGQEKLPEDNTSRRGFDDAPARPAAKKRRSAPQPSYWD